MYYRSVNRGISFTKSGWYGILFVFGIGMVAVNTGANGMFLFLSLGLALIVVSGLLSESTVKHSRVRQFGAKTVNSGEPFPLTIFAINSHRQVSLYGLEFEIYRKIPKFKFLRETPGAIAKGSVLQLNPDSTKPCICTVSGLPRGRYTELILLIKTNFPFGFISKYKTTQISGLLEVAPKIDIELLNILTRKFSLDTSYHSDDVEFHSHSPYERNKQARAIDWKKSAGKPANLWVVKEFRDNKGDFSILIRTDWKAICDSASESEYEANLSALRTASYVAERDKKSCFLQTHFDTYISGPDQILSFLVAAPQYEDRLKLMTHFPENIKSQKEAPPNPAQIFITARTHRWLTKDSNE